MASGRLQTTKTKSKSILFIHSNAWGCKLKEIKRTFPRNQLLQKSYSSDSSANGLGYPSWQGELKALLCTNSLSSMIPSTPFFPKNTTTGIQTFAKHGPQSSHPLAHTLPHHYCLDPDLAS